MTVPSPFRRKTALAAFVLTACCCTTALHAAPQVVVNAEDLDLSVPCLGRVDITVDQTMSDGVSLDSTATGGAHVTIRTGKTQGASRVLIASKSCAPKAAVSILVAPNVGVLLHDSHDTHVVINGTLASLEASLEAGQLDADTIQSLDLSLRGTEQVHIAHLNRAAQVVASGATGLVIDHADLDAFSAQLSESSHLSATNGRFDVLTLTINNAASVQIGGTVNTATVSANGTGLVAIPRVNGTLTKTGTVQVGPTVTSEQPASQPPASNRPEAATVTPPPAPMQNTQHTAPVPAQVNSPSQTEAVQTPGPPPSSPQTPAPNTTVHTPLSPTASEPTSPDRSPGTNPAHPSQLPTQSQPQQDPRDNRNTQPPGTITSDAPPTAPVPASPIDAPPTSTSPAHQSTTQAAPPAQTDASPSVQTQRGQTR